jgi:hypothetical protein
VTGPSWDDIRSVAEGSLLDGYHPQIRAVHEANAGWRR